MKSEIQKFEDLNVWNEGMQLAESIYTNLADCKDYGLKDEIQRSKIFTPSNIAEGFDRKSNKEFIHFLFISNM